MTEEERRRKAFQQLLVSAGRPNPFVASSSPARTYAAPVAAKPYQPPPKQSFFNKVRDTFDANTQADQWRRQQQGKQASAADYSNIIKRAGGVATTFGKGIAESYNYVGRGLGEAAAYNTKASKGARFAQANLQDQITRDIVGAGRRLRDPNVSPAEKIRQQRYLQSLQRENAETFAIANQRAKEIQERTDPVKGAAAVGSIGVDIATLGIGTGGVKALNVARKQGGKQFAKQLAKDSLITGAVSAPSGGLDAYVQKGKDTKFKDVAVGTGLAFGLGAALPGASFLGSKTLGKVFSRGKVAKNIANTGDIGKIAEELYQKYPDADPNKLAELAESLTSQNKAKQVKQTLKDFEAGAAKDATVVTYSGGKEGGTGFSTPDREFADVKFAQETKGGKVTERKLNVNEILDTRNPNHRARLESLLGKEQTDRLIGRNDNGLPAHGAKGDEDTLRDAADKLGFKQIALSETDRQYKYNGRDVISYADAQKAPETPTPTVKEIPTNAPAQAVPETATPSTSADLAQADLNKVPDDIQKKIENGEAITPEDMGRVAESSEVPGATKKPVGIDDNARVVLDDQSAQDALRRGSFDEAVAIYMKQGMDYGEAQKAVRRVAKESGIPLDNMGRPFVEGDPRIVDGKAIKNPDVKETMKDLSAARAISNTDAKLSSATIERAAKQYGVDTSDPGFIQRYQSGQLTDPDEIAFGNVLKRETDRIFELQKQIDPSIEYRQNYLPQSYAQDATQVDEAVKQLQTRTNAANPRQFRTYEEARQFGLAPKFQNIEQMVGESAGSAQNALANKAIVDNGLEQGLFSTRQVDRNWKVVEGFSQNGSPVYASPKVANVINNALQESTDALSKSVGGLGKLNSTWQDIMLAGGVPYTPANFFVFGQIVKEFTAGRVGVVKDFVYSMSDALTQKRFVENADFVRKMADRGLTFNIKSHIDDVDESWLANKWGKAMNKATFERFMPNQYLSVAENIYKKTGDLDLAADTVKKYYGIVDQIAKGRSTNVQNGINAAFFAPKYRESIINSIINTGKSVTTGIGDPAYSMNRRLAAGMAVTVVAAEMLQRQISGHGLLENRNGQEASIEITLGEKDEKGNQKVVNIPLMPGFLTLPRAAIRAVQGAVNGDIVGGDPNKPSVIGEASKVLATPLQVAGQVINNADYFGRPIYNNETIADQEGIEADSATSKFGKVLKYVGFQGMPGYGRAIRDAVNGKSGLEVAAQAGELPLRFGKRLNPATEAYFKDRDEVYSSLDKNGKAVWDAIHPKVKNVNGEYMTDPTVDSSLARAANYLDNPKVLEAEREMARRAKARGQKTDPLWDLDDKQQRIALRIQTLPPMDPQRDKLKKDNPWYNKLSRDRSAFFDSLPPGDPNKPKSPIDYPEPDAQNFFFDGRLLPARRFHYEEELFEREPGSWGAVRQAGTVQPCYPSRQRPTII